MLSEQEGYQKVEFLEVLPICSQWVHFITQSIYLSRCRLILEVWELLKSIYIFIHKCGAVTRIFQTPAFIFLMSVSWNCNKQTYGWSREGIDSDVLQLWNPMIRFYCHCREKDLLAQSWITRRRRMVISYCLIPAQSLISVLLWLNEQNLLATLRVFTDLNGNKILI